MNKILIVDDDTAINNMLKETLEKNGYACMQAFSGTEAMLLLNQGKYDLMLLDLMLPGISGEEVLKRTREEKKIPVIVLTAKDAMDQKIDMLLSGADDYITKPFDINEVLARIVVQIRRNAENEDNRGEEHILHFKEMQLDTLNYQVTIKDNLLKLTRQEFKILELLLKNPKKVFSKQELYDYAWEEDFFGEDKVINVHISNIRRKIKQFTDEEYIETVWGIGFALSTE